VLPLLCIYTGRCKCWFATETTGKLKPESVASKHPPVVGFVSEPLCRFLSTRYGSLFKELKICAHQNVGHSCSDSEGICESQIDGKVCWLERCTSCHTLQFNGCQRCWRTKYRPPYRVETLATGLKFPWSLAFLPNGDALVTEKFGELRILRKGALDPAPVIGGPQKYSEGRRQRAAGCGSRSCFRDEPDGLYHL
jgi:hypothetical protein